MRPSRRTARRVLLAAGVVAGLLALCSLDHAANITYGVDLTVTIIQAKKDGTNVDVDEKIDAGVKSALFKAFGSKYKKYTKVSAEVRFAHMSQNEDYELPDGRKVVVRVTGYKQLWIMFTIMVDGKPFAFKMSHGTHRVFDCGPAPDPFIVAISAKKVEVDN